MPLATVFRLSFFVTLALACASLALAETFFLWWMGLFLLGTLVLLGVAYRWEGRWVLSADAANRLGMVIAIAAAFWILYKLPRNDDDILAAGVPWPAGLLPHLGPVLIVLLLVKLFRPKQMSDFWVIQTIGLMMVTLGCVLAAEPFFGVLLILYLASLLWSLALFYMVREVACSRTQDPGQLPLFRDLSDPPPVPWRLLGLGRVTRWTVVVVVFGVMLFLIAPRHDNFQWEPKQLASAAKGALRTGFDAGIDLNRVGKVEMSDDPAFEVQAMTMRGPKLDLSPETRWFVQTLDYYAHGRWSSCGQGAAPPHLTHAISQTTEPLALPRVEGWSHPRLPPGDLVDPEYYLYFKVRLATVGGLVLAEPLVPTGPAHERRLRVGLFPHLGDISLEQSLFFDLKGTDSILSSPQGRRKIYQYGQVLHNLGPADVKAAENVNENYRRFLINQDVAAPITEWVRDLLGRHPEIEPDDRQLDARGFVPAAAHAKIARALTRHLAYSGEFGYSLDLRREQMSMDPLADFLLNVKEGHCERYAGGLTLMLRSVGIPARVVKGFRGADHLDDGLYLVRQSQAHSWVQALVTEDKETRWLVLDPTPGGERSGQPLLSWLGWLFQHWTSGDNLWRNYVMEYNLDQQGRTLEFVKQRLAPGDPWSIVQPLVAIAACLAGAYCVLRLGRRWRTATKLAANDTQATTTLTTSFYPRFLAAVERLLNLHPEPGQTPHEFGLLARTNMQVHALDETLTGIPLHLVELLYRVRFGGQKLTEEEQREALRDVEVLEKLDLAPRLMASSC